MVSKVDPWRFFEVDMKKLLNKQQGWQEFGPQDTDVSPYLMGFVTLVGIIGTVLLASHL